MRIGLERIPDGRVKIRIERPARGRAPDFGAMYLLEVEVEALAEALALEFLGAPGRGALTIPEDARERVARTVRVLSSPEPTEAA